MLSLAASQPKNSVYSYIFTSWYWPIYSEQILSGRVHSIYLKSICGNFGSKSALRNVKLVIFTLNLVVQTTSTVSVGEVAVLSRIPNHYTNQLYTFPQFQSLCWIIFLRWLRKKIKDIGNRITHSHSFILRCDSISKLGGMRVSK